MSFSRQEMADNLVRLRENSHWQYFVRTLRATYNERAQALAMSDHPDEALRGECKALLGLLRIIDTNSGPQI